MVAGPTADRHNGLRARDPPSISPVHTTSPDRPPPPPVVRRCWPPTPPLRERVCHWGPLLFFPAWHTQAILRSPSFFPSLHR
jgi:hypothetical protein